MFYLLLNSQLFPAHASWISTALFSSCPPHMHCLLPTSPSLWPAAWMKDSIPDITLIFVCLKSESTPFKIAVVLMGLKPRKMLQGLVSPSLTKSNLTALLNLWLFNWKPSTFCWGKNRYHFKNQILGNERSWKRFIAWAGIYGSMFILANVSQKQVHIYPLYRLDFSVRCHSVITLIWLRTGLLPEFCVPSFPAHLPTFFLLVILDFFLMLISVSILFLLLCASENNKLRNQGDANF